MKYLALLVALCAALSTSAFAGTLRDDMTADQQALDAMCNPHATEATCITVGVSLLADAKASSTLDSRCILMFSAGTDIAMGSVAGHATYSETWQEEHRLAYRILNVVIEQCSSQYTGAANKMKGLLLQDSNSP